MPRAASLVAWLAAASLAASATDRISSCVASPSVLFSDPLSDGKSQAKIIGGAFQHDGWKSLHANDRLLYELPQDVRAGSVEFDAMGFEIGSATGDKDARKHMWGLYDILTNPNDVKDASRGCNGFTLRIYWDQYEDHKPGETRLRLDGTLYKKAQADTEPLAWDPSKWYHFQFIWAQTRAEWRRDGQLMGSITFPDRNHAFRYLYINNDNHFTFKGLANVVYRNVIITGGATIPAASRPADGNMGAPCPPSPVIAGIQWAPMSTVVRAAEGSDNWPITWGDDDTLYTAYGDGWGFEPKVEKKLSLGLARITGLPERFKGVNIRSATGEQIGQGREGKKASGLLMVDGVLYMLVRNADNAQLAWSTDHAKTWTWTDWRFEISFGCPTFLNFGRNYAGARDQYVYVYSHDHDSAYEGGDRTVLARVPKDRIRNHNAYEFFKRLDDDGQPVWTADIAERGAVFAYPGRCYRSGISYNAGLKRYLWCQTVKGGDTRFKGGFGIYDAPEPWGPWTTVFFTQQWDMGPGESSSLPTKWMSPDGKTVHLVFSGNDCFSVRRAEFQTRRR